MSDIVLSPVVDNIEDVPESHRELYEARDGKHVLAKPIKLEDVSGLRSALDSERRLARDLAAQSKTLPPDVQERLKKAEELERQEAERKGEYQKLLQSNEEKTKAAIAERDARLQQVTTEYTTTLVENAATKALDSARGSVEGLLPHVLPELRSVEDPNKPGKFIVIVVDKKDPTKERMNAKALPMTIDELIAEKRESPVLSKFFEASPASGSGGQGSRFAPGQPRIVRLTAEESKDRAKYLELKDKKQKGEIDGALDHNGRRLI